MIPDFSKNTIDTIGKRAAYKCSNPDCGINTIGPNSDPEKATKIGEAAHIYGARIGSNRYNPKMTDSARAEITNSIWLCRNCHKLIDTDEHKYSSNVLFAWREKHEEYIASILGNTTDRIVYEEQISNLANFNEYPPIIRRIIIDKPNAWEYRLTAELMRFLNDPLFRKLNDLKARLYIKSSENIHANNFNDWIQDRISDMTRIIDPAAGLLSQLTRSWGKPGEPGDINEIHHVCILIKEYLLHVIAFEERIHFANVPEKYEKLTSLFENLIGSQVEKFSNIPSDLDEIVSLSDKREKNEPFKTIQKELVFELPENWQNEFNSELRKVKSINGNVNPEIKKSSGCLQILLILTIIIILLSLIKR